MFPVTVTQICDKKLASLPKSTLYELFHYADSDQEIKAKTVFKTVFAVQKVDPTDVREFVQGFDSKKHKTFSLKNLQQKPEKVIYHVRFLVKDVSTELNDKCYSILLYTHEGLGKEFFGAPINLHVGETARREMERKVELLCRFNSRVEAIVERRNGFYFIRDTKFIG